MLALKKLEGYKNDGDDPNESIRESIINGWIGFFRPKKEEPPVRTPSPPPAVPSSFPRDTAPKDVAEDPVLRSLKRLRNVETRQERISSLFGPEVYERLIHEQKVSLDLALSE